MKRNSELVEITVDDIVFDYILFILAGDGVRTGGLIIRMSVLVDESSFNATDRLNILSNVLKKEKY